MSVVSFQLPRTLSPRRRRDIPNPLSLPFKSAFLRSRWNDDNPDDVKSPSSSSSLPKDLTGLICATGKLGQCVRVFDPVTIKECAAEIPCECRLARIVQLPSVPGGGGCGLMRDCDSVFSDSSPFCPSSAVVVCGSLDEPHDVLLVHLGRQRHIVRLSNGHPSGFPLGIGVDPFGNWVASGGRDENRIVLWSAHTGLMRGVIDSDSAPWSTSRIECWNEWSPAHIFGGGQNARGRTVGCLFEYDVDRLTAVNSHRSAHGGWVNGICCAPQKNCLLTVGEDGFLRVWARNSFRHSTRTVRMQSGGGMSTCVCDDLNLVAVGTSEGQIEVFDLRALSGKIKALEIHTAHVNDLTRLCNTKQHSAIFLSSSDDRTIRVWDVKSGKSVSSTDLGGSVYGARAIRCGEEEESADDRVAELERFVFLVSLEESDSDSAAAAFGGRVCVRGEEGTTTTVVWMWKSFSWSL